MIKRIAIRNFKSLDVDFALDPITVLVGKSGTGKTNVAEIPQGMRTMLLERQSSIFLAVRSNGNNSHRPHRLSRDDTSPLNPRYHTLLLGFQRTLGPNS